MKRTSSPGVGYWWRFSSYEMDDGPSFQIRPAPGARLQQYDPWQEPKAYESLLEIAAAPRLYPPSVEGKQQVLDWVTKHGLLCVLAHETLMATLPAQWLPMRAFGKAPVTDDLFPTVVRYVRTGTGWRTYLTAYFQAKLHGEPDRAGSVVGRHVLSDLIAKGARVETSEVVQQPLGSDQLKREPLMEAWKSFLPAVWGVFPEDDRLPPQPLSDQFWGSYVEPLTEFLRAADELRSSLEALAKVGAGMTEEEKWAAQRGRHRLHALLSPISPALMGIEKGKLEQRWASTSLLATLAMQAFSDATADGRIIICICGRMFISSSQRREYCSEPCRWRAHQRAYRAKKKRQATPRRRKVGSR